MSTGNRYALIITNSKYDDKRLSRLTTPDADGTGLANVLKDPEICQFDQVDLLQNANSGQIRIAIANFYRNRRKDDLLLLYFSGHGILDNDRKLYLAVKDTNSDSDLVRANGIPSNYVNQLIDKSRSRRQIVMLDCCHSGAFARGSKAANNHRVNAGDAFDHNGYGTYVITATDTLQYAWEGDKLEGRYERSLFTHHVVEGLRTGQADIDQSGQITIENLYHYVHDRVREDGDEVRRQTPTRWVNKGDGSLIIARNPIVINEPPPPQYQGELPLSEMRKLMLIHLEAEDINDIAFDLNIPERLGEQPSKLIRRILAKLDEREQLQELMLWLWQNKPELCQVLFGDQKSVLLLGRSKPKPSHSTQSTPEKEIRPTQKTPKREASSKLEDNPPAKGGRITDDTFTPVAPKHEPILPIKPAIEVGTRPEPTPQTWTPPTLHGIEWVEIPAGPFWMGAAEKDYQAYDEEKSGRQLGLPTYWIGKTAVTNAQYRAGVQARAVKAPSHWKNGTPATNMNNHPVVYVSWDDAIAYCQWLSQESGLQITLPSEAEWEKAARGEKDQRIYPWGNSIDLSKCNYMGSQIGSTTPIDKYPEGISPYGVWDMVGNVWEWTRSKQDGYPYNPSDGREDLLKVGFLRALGDGNWRMLRGGSWRNNRRNIRVSYRFRNDPFSRGGSAGFRVVLVRPPSR
jgi:formylglycine-generating enzyme required for sulfatase activity